MSAEARPDAVDAPALPDVDAPASPDADVLTPPSADTSKATPTAPARLSRALDEHLGAPDTGAAAWRVASAGGGLYMLALKVASDAANLATAGWLFPALKSVELSQLAKRMRVDGRHLSYHGSIAAVLTLWAKVWLLSVCTLGVYWWWRGRHAMSRYFDANITWAGTPPRDAIGALKATLTGEALAQQRWRVVSTNRGLARALVELLLRGLNLISLGLLYPWIKSLQLRHWASWIRLDGHPVRYRGSGFAIARVWLRVWALSWLTLGIYWSYKGKGAVHAYFDQAIAWRGPAPEDIPSVEATRAAVEVSRRFAPGAALTLAASTLIFTAAWWAILSKVTLPW